MTTWFEQASSVNPAFQTVAEKQPYFNVEPPYGARFESGRFLNLDDSDLINTQDSTKKDFYMTFKTGSEVDTRQVLFEEGGTTNGLNVYIENGLLYWSIWSQSSGWSYTYISTAIGPQQDHSLRFHYDGEEGFLEAYLDNHRIRRVVAGEKLAAHSGNNGFGAQVEASHYVTGSDSRAEDFSFKGVISEFIYY